MLYYFLTRVLPIRRRLHAQIAIILCLAALSASSTELPVTKQKQLWSDLPVDNCDFIPSKDSPVEIKSVRTRSPIRITQRWILARLQYSINLRTPLISRYDLAVTVRYGVFPPPFYHHEFEDICEHWSARVSSKCQRRKHRFYQRRAICLCDMPSGQYSQKLRLRMATPKILEFMAKQATIQKEYPIQITLQLRDKISQKSLMCYTITVPVIL